MVGDHARFDAKVNNTHFQHQGWKDDKQHLNVKCIVNNGKSNSRNSGAKLISNTF